MEINLEMPSFPGTSTNKLDTTPLNHTGNCNHIIQEEENLNSLYLRDGIGGDTPGNGGAGVNLKNGNDDKGQTVFFYEPRKSLEFESKEAAYSFYREYARSVGFGITIKASRSSKKSGKFIDVKIACSRFGSQRESCATVNARSCPKTDCKASMHMKRRADGKWYIYSIVKEHNHEICPDDFYIAIRGRHKQFATVVSQKKGLQLALSTEDVKLLLDHLTLVQCETPNFYYALDFNKERRLNNVFWIDGKGRNDYRQFFDVVFFDTSYLRKGYKLPFVPVVGVNHHYQYILLGCALIGDETSLSFIWLMRTWLRAVGGRRPIVVITAYDKSLKEAVEVVFPDARHCFCLWDILGEISKSLSHKANNFEDFEVIFHKCIHQSWTDEEFQNRWQQMVDKFELGDDGWIRSLYDDREKWVPAYMSDTFLGGICTIERSESISSFFDKYIHKETSFREFLDQYKSFLRYRNEEEDKAEFETKHYKPILKSLSSFEEQMSTIYTHAIFKKFQAEVLGIVACDLQREVGDETTVTFQVNDPKGHQNHIVAWKEVESDISCSCRLFEYKGFLCRHAMIVLQFSGASNIPTQYILKRWTRNAKIRAITSVVSSSVNVRVQRLNNLCKFAIILGEEGSLSRETYGIASFALEEALKQCVDLHNSTRSVLETKMLVTQGSLNIEDGNLGSNNAKASKRKKLMKKHKVQEDDETASVGIQSCCRKMEQLKQRMLALETSYVPQPDVQGMEFGSRTLMIDRCYGAQQSVQELGQPNSLASLGEGFYSNQHGLPGNLNSTSAWVGHYAPQQSRQGLGQQLGFRAANAHGCFDILETLQDTGISKNPAKHSIDKYLSP